MVKLTSLSLIVTIESVNFRHKDQTPVYWPDPDKGPLEVVVHWHMMGGRWECVGLTIDVVRPLTGPPNRAPIRPLTTNDLRSISMRELLDRARREHARLLRSTLLEDEEDDSRLTQIVDGLITAGGPRRPGRPPLPRAHLEAVAKVYRDAYISGENPTATVAEKFHVTRTAAAKWIDKCRADDVRLLGKTSRGKAGGIVPPEQKEDT